MLPASWLYVWRVRARGRRAGDVLRWAGCIAGEGTAMRRMNTDVQLSDAGAAIVCGDSHCYTRCYTLLCWRLVLAGLQGVALLRRGSTTVLITAAALMRRLFDS